MFEWSTGAGDAAKLKTQFVADVYKSLQSRLDGYRTAAGAIFLAVMAASLTFDSNFSRFLIDPALVKNLKDQHALSLAENVVKGGGILVVVIGLVSLWVLMQLASYFAEMTSIVYKIDEANGAFVPNAFIKDHALFPLKFRLGGAPGQHDVSRHPMDRPLKGWRDPAIDLYIVITVIVTLAHVVLYVDIARQLV